MWTRPHSSQASGAVELEPAEVGDGGAPADGRHGAVVAIAERRRRGAAGEPRAQHARDVGALLLGDRREAGQRLAVAHRAAWAVSPMTKISGWPGTTRSGPTMTRPARSCLDAEPSRGRRGRDAGGPDDGRGLPGARRRWRRRLRRTGRPACRAAPRHAAARASAARLRSASRERPAAARGPASTSTMRASRGSMVRKSWRSATWASSAMAPAISTPVGPPPITTKVRKRRRSSGVVGRFGVLEGGQDAAADAGGVVDLLQAGRHALPSSWPK